MDASDASPCDHPLAFSTPGFPASPSPLRGENDEDFAIHGLRCDRFAVCAPPVAKLRRSFGARLSPKTLIFAGDGSRRLCASNTPACSPWKVSMRPRRALASNGGRRPYRWIISRIADGAFSNRVIMIIAAITNGL